MIEEANLPYMQTPKFNENDHFHNEIFISEIIEEIISNIVPDEKPSFFSTHNSSNEILVRIFKLIHFLLNKNHSSFKANSSPYETFSSILLGN